MFSLVFLMLRIVFFVFSIIFGKTSVLFLLSVLSIIRCELCSVLTHCDVPYCVMRTAILLFVFRIVFFQIRVFREIGRYGLVRVIYKLQKIKESMTLQEMFYLSGNNFTVKYANVSLCTAVLLPSKKSGNDFFEMIFLRGAGRLYTGYANVGFFQRVVYLSSTRKFCFFSG